MPLPVNAIWDETMAFARRESKLLVPLALATLALGYAGVQLSSELSGAKVISGGLYMAMVLPSLAIVTIGQLAILALALRPGSSVAEALRTGASRLVKVLFQGMIVGGLGLLLIAPVVAFLEKSGYDLLSTPPKIPALAVFYFMVVMVLMIWISIRLYTFSALVVDRNPPLGEAMRQSFAQTRGHTLVLVGIVLIFLVVTQVVQIAAGAVVGLIFGFLAKAAGAPVAGMVMAALAVGMVAAAVSLIASVFAAFAYRHLAAG